MFSVSFKGVGYQDALALAKKFDWKAIQAAAHLKWASRAGGKEAASPEK